MKMLYVSDVYGNDTKLNEFLGLVKNIKPTVSIINGNIFPYHQLNNESELKKVIPIINDIATRTKLFIQFGGDDLQITYKKYLSEFENVENLTNNVCEFNGYSLMGLNYSPNWWVQERKDWIRRDGLFYRQYVEEPQGIYSDESNIYQIRNLEEHLNSLPSISEIIKIQLEKIPDITKTIVVTCSPPIGLGLDCSQEYLHWGSYSIRRLVEGDFTDSKQPMICLSSGFIESTQRTKNATHELKDCYCFNSGQSNVALSFLFLELTSDTISRVQHSIYPLTNYVNMPKTLSTAPIVGNKQCD